MKFLKHFVLLLLLIIVTGCGNKEFDKLYEKMHNGEEGINGYFIDLRIYGSASDVLINDMIRISNYKDREFKITIVDSTVSVDPLNGQVTEDNNNIEFYVKKGKIYINKNGSYKETTEKQNFSNPLIYLEGLKNVTQLVSETEELIGENNYKVYNLKVKYDFAKEILNEIGKSIKNLKEEDIEAKIYINEDDYIYRIMYMIDSLTVSVNYFGIDNSAEIVIP